MLFVAEEVRTIIAALGILDWTGGGLDTHLYEEVRLFDLSTKNETLIFKSFDCYMICYIWKKERDSTTSKGNCAMYFFLRCVLPCF